MFYSFSCTGKPEKQCQACPGKSQEYMRMRMYFQSAARSTFANTSACVRISVHVLFRLLPSCVCESCPAQVLRFAAHLSPMDSAMFLRIFFWHAYVFPACVCISSVRPHCIFGFRLLARPCISNICPSRSVLFPVCPRCFYCFAVRMFFLSLYYSVANKL